MEFAQNDEFNEVSLLETIVKKSGSKMFRSTNALITVVNKPIHDKIHYITMTLIMLQALSLSEWYFGEPKSNNYCPVMRTHAIQTIIDKCWLHW